MGFSLNVNNTAEENEENCLNFQFFQVEKRQYLPH